jgi:hypothetical protein
MKITQRNQLLNLKEKGKRKLRVNQQTIYNE